MSAAVELVRTPESAAVLLDPLRMRIVEALDEPDSAAGVARQLDLPRQRVNYHVRELEKEGFVREVGTRRTGNFVERLVQATARRYIIVPGALGGLAADPEELRDRFSSAYLAAVAARTLEEVARLREGADAEGKMLATLAAETEVRFASPHDQAAFAEELVGCLTRLAAEHGCDEGEDGRAFRFTVTGLPTVVEASSPRFPETP